MGNCDVQENTIWGTCHMFFFQQLQNTTKQELIYTTPCSEKLTSKGFTLQSEKGNAETLWAFLHRSQKMDMNSFCFCTLNCLDLIQLPGERSPCSAPPCLRSAAFGPELACAWPDWRAGRWIGVSPQPSLLSAGWLTAACSKKEIHSGFHHLRNSFCFIFWGCLIAASRIAWP